MGRGKTGTRLGVTPSERGDLGRRWLELEVWRRTERGLQVVE